MIDAEIPVELRKTVVAATRHLADHMERVLSGEDSFTGREPRMMKAVADMQCCCVTEGGAEILLMAVEYAASKGEVFSMKGTPTIGFWRYFADRLEESYTVEV